MCSGWGSGCSGRRPGTTRRGSERRLRCEPFSLCPLESGGDPPAQVAEPYHHGFVLDRTPGLPVEHQLTAGGAGGEGVGAAVQGEEPLGQANDGVTAIPAGKEEENELVAGVQGRRAGK